ncbi:MAG: glycosyl hydrolase [Armatimonadota bacterium]
MTTLTAQYFLNHRLDPDEIRRQVREMADAGYEVIYPHARQGMLTPWFSEDWWRALDAIAEVCRETGMRMDIWDEDYFPSGLAGGRVVWSDPGLVARGLSFTVREVEGGGPFEVDFTDGHLLRCHAIPVCGDEEFGDPLDVTQFVGTRRQRWLERRVNHGAYSPLISRVGPPHRRTTMRDNAWALAWTPPEPGRWLIVASIVDTGAGRLHPDLLRPEGIARFLEIAYEPYAKRYPDEMGELIGAAFTDEPSPGGPTFPWTERFPEQFAADHGYDILDALPHLAADLDDRSPQVRHHFRITQGRLQRENYVEQIADWCHEHGIEFSGHLTRQEWLQLVALYWPNEIRCYQAMDIPACDPLGAAIGWPDAAAYHAGVKVASSAAHLFGREKCSSDCLAVLGDSCSLADLKYMLDYQMVLGVNHFTMHGLDYSIDGPRKYETPPSLFYQHTQWRHMSTLLTHVRETAEALTGGRHICDLAVLYPSTTLGAAPTADYSRSDVTLEEPVHELVETLLSHQRDFDFIDEITLAESVAEDGSLATPEAYSTIILPHLRWIDEAAAKALLRFIDGGGRVIAVRQMPLALTHDADDPQRAWADERVEHADTIDEQTIASLPGIAVSGEGACDIFVLQREVDGIRRLFALNRAEREFVGEIEGEPVRIPPRSSVMLEAGADGTRTSPRPIEAGETVTDLSSGWTVEFEPNHVPLSFWHVGPGDGPETAGFTSLPTVDLLDREGALPDEGEEPLHYSCRVMVTDPIPGAWLVMDASAIGGEWTVRVNGQEVTDWREERVYDCNNRVADVGEMLHAGSTPTLNVITVETAGPGRGLYETLYLYGAPEDDTGRSGVRPLQRQGDFACEFRYAHRSMPFLSGDSGRLALDTLQDWAALGRPTFSGGAIYRRALSVKKDGRYVLDLGRVEGVAAVSIDGEELEVLAWPPFVSELELEAGEHEIAIEVTNPPANRNWAAGVVAGLLGPVVVLMRR